MAVTDRKNRSHVKPKQRGDAVADLNQNISATYVEAEVQAISDKVDELLAELRAVGTLPSA